MFAQAPSILRSLLLSSGLLLAFGAFPLSAQSANMTFFITDEGMPGVADAEDRFFLGDSFCHHQAYAAGFGDLEWRAYLDGPDPGGEGAVRGGDRIGSGPWHNFQGTLIASDVEELHSDAANLTPSTVLTARGSRAPSDAPAIPSGPELAGASFSLDRPFLCFASD